MTFRSSSLTLSSALMLAVMTGAPKAQADSTKSAAKFASGTGTIVFLAGGVLLPLLEDGKDGKHHALRTADALLTSTAITEGLKRVIHEDRPNHSDDKSFPSGHATAAFAVAAMQAHYHPGQAWLWYGGASLIAASRVKLREHFTHDVVAGAAVGYLTARWELRNKRGLLFAPLIHSDKDGGSTYGLSVNGNF